MKCNIINKLQKSWKRYKLFHFFRNINTGGMMGGGGSSRFGNQTYGLSPQFLDSLGIDGPLHNRLFVANLAYSVDEKKLREVFRLAGRVVTAELNRDKV
jgi:hypothetical protein